MGCDLRHRPYFGSDGPHVTRDIRTNAAVTVALKRLRISAQIDRSEAAERRFLREALTWRALDFPHVLPFIGVLLQRGHVYLVSPFVENGSLTKYLRCNPDANRTRLLFEIALTIAYLHRLGLIHGDLKAANVLVSGDHNALVCDLGLARFEGVSTSAELRGAGTTRWQSPEVINGASKSFESDIYAFGMTIYEVLSGQVPFSQHSNTSTVILAILRHERPPTEPEMSPSGELYAWLWTVAESCWDPSPDSRPNGRQVVGYLTPHAGVPYLTHQQRQRISITTSSPDPLEPFFRTVQERNLIRHYCQTSTRLMMAVPSSLNPILSIHLPVILSSCPTTSISAPSILQPSLHAGIEALRLSLLGVASMHQAYLLSKSGPENRQVAAEMWNLAGNLRIRASRSLGAAVANVEGCCGDATLGACVSIALIDIFAGGYNYVSNMELAKTLIELRGGPQTIVRYAPASIQGEAGNPIFLGPVHSVEAGDGSQNNLTIGTEKAKKSALISSARLLLETLVVYDVNSTLTSGEQPSLLRPGDTAWWFEGDKSNYHLFSVENVFGVARSIVELFARVVSFLNRHHCPAKLRKDDSKIEPHVTPISSRPSAPTPSLSSLTEASPTPGSPLARLHSEASALLQEVGSWKDPMVPITSMHPRVKYGNDAHKSILVILLLREAFNVPANDPRVQKWAELSLLDAIKASAEFAMSVGLTWPVIIAGCQCSGPLRLLAQRALEGFKKQYCFEIDTSERILTEVWRRMDGGLPRADFRGVVEDLNLRVLMR